MTAPTLVDRIKITLVRLRMPRTLEIVDVIVRQLERFSERCLNPDGF